MNASCPVRRKGAANGSSLHRGDAVARMADKMTANFEQATTAPSGRAIDATGSAGTRPAATKQPTHPKRRFPRRQAATGATHAPDLWNLFRQAPGFVCILRGPNHVFEFANAAYLQLVGGRDVIGKSVCEALPEVATQLFPRVLDEVYRSGKPYVGLATPAKLQWPPDAPVEHRVVDFVYQPLKDEQGRTTGVFVEGIDITERVRAQTAVQEGEAELNRQRRFFETVLTNTPDHAYIFGLDHRFIYANAQLRKVLGQTRDGVVGKSFREVGYPEWHAARHDREIEKVIATRQAIRGVVTFTGPLGRRVYDYIFTPVLDEAGVVEAIAGTTRDITELTWARRATARLASIVDSSDDAIVSKDLHGVILTWNKSAERMFGYTAAEAIGRPITELIIPADRLDEEADILRKLARGEAIDHHETVRRRKDGSTLDISVTISPLREHGRIVGGSKIAHDISERKRHERRRELLIHELNHRVKNTLATVQSIALHSLRDADSVAAGYAAFDARLLALSRAHNVLTRADWACADLKAIVTGAIKPYTTPNHACRFDVTGDALELRPHAGLMLAMALHELATNAVKYGALSSEHGQVAIRWWQTAAGESGRSAFHLLWTERDGPRVNPPQQRGFGSRLLEQGLARDLGGTVDLRFEPSGVVCEITAPLDEIVARQEPPPLGVRSRAPRMGSGLPL